MSERVLRDARKRPKKALAEAIWNSLDAGADHVQVKMEIDDALGGIEAIEVVDDGAGMNRERAELDFRTYGDSWKARIDARTHNERSIHGQRGQGRYDILRLGSQASWRSVSDQATGERGEITAILRSSDPKSYEISDVRATDEPTATTLRVTGITEEASRELSHPDLVQSLATDLALYLRQYPTVEVSIDGERVDPASLHDKPVDMQVRVDELDDPVVVTFIQWHSRHPGTQRIHLCDSHGASLLDISADVRAGDISFTAYVRWDGFKDPDTSASLAVIGGEDLGSKVLEAGRAEVQKQLQQLAEAGRARLLQEWKADDTYPLFDEAKSKEKGKRAVRQSFDIAAVAASSVLSKMDREQRRFALRLMKVALESNPSALQTIFREVLKLPEDRVQELAKLFDHTSLESMIKATRQILDRLAFLSGLRAIVFQAEARKATLERRHLHKILERETWIFGDEWTLTSSDESLRRVLVKHLGQLGDEVEFSDVMPQSQADGDLYIPDLVLSTSASSYSKQLEYLVVELKRPSKRLGKTELDQIEAYAIAIVEDPEFSQPNVAWDFWLIGGSYDDYIARKLATPDHPHGVALVDSKFRVHVRTWAEIIADAEHRHRYVQEALDARPDQQQGVEFLNRVHRELLPDVLRDVDDATDDDDGSSASASGATLA